MLLSISLGGRCAVRIVARFDCDVSRMRKQALRGLDSSAAEHSSLQYTGLQKATIRVCVCVLL